MAQHAQILKSIIRYRQSYQKHPSPWPRRLLRGELPLVCSSSGCNPSTCDIVLNGLNSFVMHKCRPLPSSLMSKTESVESPEEEAPQLVAVAEKLFSTTHPSASMFRKASVASFIARLASSNDRHFEKSISSFGSTSSRRQLTFKPSFIKSSKDMRRKMKSPSGFLLKTLPRSSSSHRQFPSMSCARWSSRGSFISAM